MKSTNASSTASVHLHDSLESNKEEHYQGGVKDVALAPSGTRTLPNTNVAESREVQDGLEAGTITATQADLGTLPNSGTGVDNHPEVPGSILGQGAITYIGMTPSIAGGSATHIISFSAGVVGADQVVRGFDFAATTEYGAAALAVDTAGATAVSDITFTKATNKVTITNTHATDAARGYSPNVVICDEMAFWENALYIFNQVIEPMVLQTKGKILCLSTPNGRLGPFWDIFNKDSEVSKYWDKYSFDWNIYCFINLPFSDNYRWHNAQNFSLRTID